MRFTVCIYLLLTTAVALAAEPVKPVEVVNFPEVQRVSVDNFPELQQVSGVVSIDNWPAVQQVEVVNPAGGGAQNQVIDLLDTPFTVAGNNPWRSPAIDTTAYNRVGYRVSFDSGTSLVICQLEWRFAADEAFVAAPAVAGFANYCSPLSPSLIAFCSVAGLETQLYCRLNSPGDVPRVMTDAKVLLRRE